MDSNYYRETQHSSSVATAHPACRVLTHANRQISLAPFLLCTCTVVLYMKRKQKRWRGEKQHSKKQKQNLTPKALFEQPLTYFHQTHPRQSSAEVSKFSWCCWNQLCVFPHTITQTHTRGRKYLSLPVFMRSRSRSHTWWMLGALFKSGPRGSGSRGKQDGKGKWRERERGNETQEQPRGCFFWFLFFMQKQSRLNLVALPVRRCTNDQGGSAVVRLKHRSVESFGCFYYRYLPVERFRESVWM